MLETWRWFGPDDPVSLQRIIQAGASGVVTALHDIPTGEAWPLERIIERKQIIEEAGLSWSVIESVPIHNDIKTRSGDYRRHIHNYLETLRNLGSAGLETVCYNFMPVVDWTRTDLMYEMPNTGFALRFDMADFAAYDIYILEREDAAGDYSEDVQARAQEVFARLTQEQREGLERNIIAGLPGGEGSYDREGIRVAIQQFIDLGEEGLRRNLELFLQEVVPVAEAAGVRLAIHPDDPPFSLFGLPRVVSTAEDARRILAAAPSTANGLTLCAGSFGARGDNDLIAIAEEFAENIHFVHLRNVKREADGSFYEAEHLAGDNNMVGLIDALISEEANRRSLQRADVDIPMRPDHGHLFDEEGSESSANPGYSYLGRMRGLAELRGVIHALEATRGVDRSA